MSSLNSREYTATRSLKKTRKGAFSISNPDLPLDDIIRP